uniref:Ig domain-containing protein n=1 Tax=Dissulfurispira sp. TaxID=2817609 RepID=UPI002FD97E70
MGLIGPLTKRAKLIETREIVKTAYESILGYAASNKRLPDNLNVLGIKTTDAYMRGLQYFRVGELVTSNLCTTAGTYLTVNDSSSGTSQTKNNVVFILFAEGDNRTNDTGSASPFAIREQGVNDYDDIVMYADIDKLRSQICTSFTITTDSLPIGTEEMPYPQTTLEATDGTPPYRWGIQSGSLPLGLSLSSDGTISGTPTADGSYNFTVQVTDSDTPNRIATKSLAITINPNKPRITTEFLSYGTQNQAYAANLSATGGLTLTPYTWTVSGLPSGLSLLTSGTCTAGSVTLNCNATTPCICGTPTVSGTFTITTEITDGRSRTASKTLSIAINVAATAGGPTCTLTANPSSRQTAGSSILTWSINNGPANGTWSPAPGGGCANFSGSSGGSCTTGTINSTTTFTLTVTNAQGSSQCAATVYVGVPPGPAPSCTLVATPNPVPIGNPTTLTWSINNGPANGTWSPAPGGGCANFSNSYGGNCITGNINDNKTFQLTVSNANGIGLCATTAYASWTAVCPVPSITPTSLPNGRINLAYSVTLQGSGGMPPYTWSWTGNPPGLSLNSSTGQITGTPTTPGVYNSTVTLTDSCPQSISRTYTIAIGRHDTYQVRNMRGTAFWVRGGQYSSCTRRLNNQTFNVGRQDTSAVNIYTNSSCTTPASLSSVSYATVIPVDEAGNRNGIVRINQSWQLVD